MARDNLQVDKLLKLKPTRTELHFPPLPTYEEPFDGEKVDEERQRDQRNEKKKVDRENECKQIEQKVSHDRKNPLGRGRPKGQKPHIPLLRSRREKDIPSKKPAHKNRAVYHQRACT